MTNASTPPEPGQALSAPMGASMPSLGDEAVILQAIAEGVARPAAQDYFPSLVYHLARALAVPYAYIAEFAPGNTRARTRAYWAVDRVRENVEFDLAGTPGEAVARGEVSHHPEGVRARFPQDRLMVEAGIEGYLGLPLRAADGSVLGLLAVFDTRPLPAEPRRLAVGRIFADRAAAELERLRLEQQIQYLRDEIKAEHDFEQIIGRSIPLRAVLDKVRLLAGTDSTILIFGEPGTG